MDQRVIELLVELVELLRQQQQQQQQQQQDAAHAEPKSVRKVTRMLDIVARLPIDLVRIADGVAYITHGDIRRVKVILPKELRGAAPEDLRDVLFAFSVDLMERPDGRRFTAIRGRPISQGEAKNRLVLRAGMVRSLAEQIVRLPGIGWCLYGTEAVLEKMAVPPGD